MTLHDRVAGGLASSFAARQRQGNDGAHLSYGTPRLSDNWMRFAKLSKSSSAMLRAASGGPGGKGSNKPVRAALVSAVRSSVRGFISCAAR